MVSRRQFLIMSASAGALAGISMSVLGKGAALQATRATAITQGFGDGIRLTAVALEYDAPVKGVALSPASFRVEGRTVTGAFTSRSANPADRADGGRFVIVTLSPDDPSAPLAQQAAHAGPGQGKAAGGGGPGGPGNAGDIPQTDTFYKPAKASVVQAAPIALADGATVPANPRAVTTSAVENLIVDDFRQFSFHDPRTGRSLPYNLYVPKGYDAGKKYPLVLFMHDAGATSSIVRTTLFQGLGAVAWASPEDQAKRPCFVLAPQYNDIIADDEARTSNALDTTIDLIKALLGQYSIDAKRLYTTGQSGGCMMSIAMDIKYPNFFAASFLVAGQWDPALVAPLARQRLWILVSQDDDKAFPGENAITHVLETHGAHVSRAVWDGTWGADQFQQAFHALDAAHSPINYVSFKKGTVIPPGSSTAGASGHRNTWRIAYTIEPIRAWLFRQINDP